MVKHIIEALEKPEAYDHSVDTVKKIVTAVSVVMLTGDFAYKFNKPLNLGFLDFSTLEKRKEQCEKEVKYNSLISPSLYLGVVAITEDGKINGSGSVIEYAVKMKQMDPDSVMENGLVNGKVTSNHVKEIASKIFAFHQVAASGEDVSKYASLESIKFNWQENFEQTEKFVDVMLSRDDFDFIRSKVDSFIALNEELFSLRVKSGKIKHCHGDFHSGNVFVSDEVDIFDGIVFNERFPCSDVVAEVAFMAMDLDFHGRQDYSQLFVDEYKKLSFDSGIELLLNFYKCYRAYIRAKINCFGYEGENSLEFKENAQKYFKLAKSYADYL